VAPITVVVRALLEPRFLLATCATAFVITLACTRAWIRVSSKMGLVARDQNKHGDQYAAESGGMWVSVGSSFGLMLLVALYRYLEGFYYHLEALFSLTVILLLSSFLGFMDDLLGWKKGLKVWQRVALMGPLALPLVVIKAGTTKMELPLVGVVDFGPLYPLLLVPIGVIGASNAFNMLAGYNGLEAGMGFLLMAFVGAYAALKNLDYIAYASLIMMASLLAFLVYNWYPARAFPGNSLTYGFGAYYAGLVILGNFERFGVLLFGLYFVELLLFVRGLLNGVYKENFGKPRPDGTLEPPYEKSYSVTHLAIKVLIGVRGYATERAVVLLVLLLQLALGVLLQALVSMGKL